MGKLILYNHVLHYAWDELVRGIGESPAHQILERMLLRQLAFDVSDNAGGKIGVVQNTDRQSNNLQGTLVFYTPEESWSRLLAAGNTLMM